MAETTKKARRTKAVGYVRVSTMGQSQEGEYGIEAQEASLRAYARAKGLHLVGICRDVVSGTSDLGDREGLACVLDALKQGNAEVVVVPRLDRLARDVVVQESLIREIRGTGGDIQTASEREAHCLTDDPDDPSRELIRVILGAVASYERQMIGLRMRSGRRRKREAGGYADGSPPYGFRAEGGSLVADDSEQKVLRRMKAMKRKGESLRAIASALNAEGVPSKRGAQWSASSVARCLDPAARERARVSTAKRRQYAKAA